MRARGKRTTFAVALMCTGLVVAMGTESCEESQIEFPAPDQQGYAPDEGAVLIQAWDFQTCDGTWTSDGDVWECGEPTSGPRAGVEGSGNVLATNPAGDMPPVLDESIMSPVLDLSSYEGQSVFLSTWHWYSYEPTGDKKGGGRVEVFYEGAWQPVEPAGGYDGPIKAPATSLHGEEGFANGGIVRTWRHSYFDISSYLGPDFQIRFHVVNKGGKRLRMVCRRYRAMARDIQHPHARDRSWYLRARLFRSVPC